MAYQSQPEGGLPSSIHMEVAILGCMMLDQEAVETAMRSLVESDFALHSHQVIFRRMGDVVRSGVSLDYQLLWVELEKHRELQSIGGPAYLLSLCEGIPRNFNIESYVRIVKDKAQLRQIMAAGQFGIDMAVDQSEDAQTVARGLIDRLAEIIDSGDDGDIPHVSAIFQNESSHSTAEVLAEELSVRNGIRYGFSELDEATGGAQKGDLIIVAGRPSMGKTAWLTTVARYMAENEGAAVAVFSMEQKKEAMLRRMLSAAARVDYQDIRRGVVRPHEQALLDERWHTLATAPLYIDDTPGLTVARIRSKAKRLKRQLEAQGRTLDAIFIDQLSKIKCEAKHARLQKREQIGEITEDLKALAQELDVPVILLVQIGREAVKRTDSRPALGDLKDSGDIEEDADVVIFPHRPEYYDKEDKSLEGKAELIIAKQREGPTKTCRVLYQGRIMRFEDEQPAAAKQDSFYEYTPY